MSDFITLFEAVRSGEVIKVQQLLSELKDINYQDDHKQTLLHAAAMQANPFLVQMLVNRNANLLIADQHGMTPILRAIEKQQIPTFQLLKRLGSDLESVDSHGRNALYWAIKVQNVEILSDLLESEVDTNLQFPWEEENQNSDCSYSILHLAVLSKNLEIVQLIANANKRLIAVQNSKSQTPEQLAIIVDQQEIANYLQNISNSIDHSIINSQTTNNVGLALFPYNPDIFQGDTREGDLFFNSGDVITNIHKTPRKWWYGSCNEKSGWFPSNFVAVKCLHQAKVKYDYNANRPDELTIKQGSTVRVYETKSNGWARIISDDNHGGLVPANYLLITQPLTVKRAFSSPNQTRITTNAKPPSLLSFQSTENIKAPLPPPLTSRKPESADNNDSTPSPRQLSNSLDISDSDTNTNTNTNSDTDTDTDAEVDPLHIRANAKLTKRKSIKSLPMAFKSKSKKKDKPSPEPTRKQSTKTSKLRASPV